MWSRVLIAALTLSCVACASYRTPGGAVPLEVLNRTVAPGAEPPQPSSRFPARMAVARVQAAHYQSLTAEGQGKGALTVLPAQELLGAPQLDQLARWPAVAAAFAIEAPMLPEQPESIDDLRMAAAKGQADMLLVYTVDTAFQLKGRRYAPLAKLPLGSTPDAQDHISSQALAVFLDVRTGFVYGVVEATAQVTGLDQDWGKPERIDQKRLAAEQQAFGQLLTQAAQRWAEIVARHQ
ncbi:MAG: hypothetical protein Q7J29_04770 [Stagnimonas sp.]|nr:hypothetical protein [Stagnimonas sp.]